MDDKKKMTVAEILAAARKSDSGNAAGSGGASANEGVAASQPAPPPASPPASDTPGAKPSVAEILAKARAEKQAAAAPKAESSAPETAKPAPPATAGGKPSVADILAAARQAKGGAAATPAAAESTPAKAPAAKSVEKKAVVPEEPVAPAGPPQTASILAAARADKKRGPLSKAEAGIASEPRENRVENALAKPGKPAVPPMPAKPAYAQKKPADAKKVDQGRRGVLAMMGAMVGTSLGIGFGALAGTFGLWTLGFARFMFPNILTEPPSQFKIGQPSDFPPGMVDERFKAAFGVWVVNGEYNGQQLIYALKTVCTHLGCTPNWLESEQKFKCPCHGSGFYVDGINFEGPAPRPLERYAIRLADDGQIEIDKSRVFQEEKGEWTNSDSFVVV